RGAFPSFVAFYAKVVVGLYGEFAGTGTAFQNSLGKRNTCRDAVLEHFIFGYAAVLVYIIGYPLAIRNVRGNLNGFWFYCFFGIYLYGWRCFYNPFGALFFTVGSCFFCFATAKANYAQ